MGSGERCEVGRTAHLSALPIVVRKRPVSARRSAIMSRNEPHLAGLLAGPAVARRALRWQVLHRRADKRSLLPSDLSRADRERRKRPLFSKRRVGRGSGLSSLFTVSSGMFAGNSGVARNSRHGRSSPAADQRERPRRWRNRKSCRASRSRIAPLAPLVSAAPRRDAQCSS